jgi:hypothetical protein
VPGAELEILEQAIDFPPQALERPPLGRTISPSLFLSHRQFGCSLSHVASPYFAHDGKSVEYCQLRRVRRGFFDLNQETPTVFYGSLAPNSATRGSGDPDARKARHAGSSHRLADADRAW